MLTSDNFNMLKAPELFVKSDSKITYTGYVSELVKEHEYKVDINELKLSIGGENKHEAESNAYNIINAYHKSKLNSSLFTLILQDI